MTVSEKFDSGIIERLDRLSLKYRGRIGGVSGGMRRSNEKGSSNEFSDFRSYNDGDSLRYVDWNSYARLDRLFIKLYTEEKQASVNILEDCSASMSFGLKPFMSGMLAAALCYCTVHGGDRVYFTANSTFAYSAKQQLGELLAFIDKIAYNGEFKPFEVFRSLNMNQRGKLLLISDLLYPLDKLEEAIKYAVYKKQELTIIMLNDDAELNPQFGGSVTLNDSETGDKLSLEIDDDVLSAYQNALRQHKGNVARLCRRYGVYLTEIAADEDFNKILTRVIS